MDRNLIISHREYMRPELPFMSGTELLNCTYLVQVDYGGGGGGRVQWVHFLSAPWYAKGRFSIFKCSQK